MTQSPRYETYLLNTINDNVIPMLEDLNTYFLPDVHIKYVLPIKAHGSNPGMMPYWSVYAVPPGRSALISRAGLGNGEMVHVIGLRLWFAPDTAGTSSGAEHLMWLNFVAYPTTVMYFMQRPSLKIDDSRSKPRYLDQSKTVIDLASEIGVLPDTVSPIFGMDLHLALTFNFALSIR